MTSTAIRTKSSHYSSVLRNELIVRNRAYAKKHGLVFQESYGSFPVIVYALAGCPERHGNFQADTYDAICANAQWKRHVGKAHAQARTSLPRTERKWCKLDSSMSSDALLMNVFCHRHTLENTDLRLMLGVEADAIPEFGFRARVPLASGAGDRTEIDMRLGSLLVEAKLTESDFQRKSKDVLDLYRDFTAVFDRRLLTQSNGIYESYQLIRNVLAAFATGSSFCVLLDGRRPDLLEQWYAVMRAVRDAEMHVRCKVLTWQELTPLLSPDLQAFLDEKYGIVPPGALPTNFEGAEL